MAVQKLFEPLQMGNFNLKNRIVLTLAEFRAEYDGVIMGNCGYTKESAEERLAAGDADLAAFGRPFIANPDLPERLKNNWPLTPFEDMSLWYTPGAEGYTDYNYYQ